MPSATFGISSEIAFAQGAVMKPFRCAGSTRALQNFSIASDACGLLQFDVHGSMSKPALSSSRIEAARFPCDSQLSNFFSSSGRQASFFSEKSAP